MEVLNLEINENWETSFEVKLDGDEWKDFLSRASADLQKKQAIPGYRAGKAPLAMVEKAFGRALYEPAARAAMTDCLMKACTSNDLSPITEPQYDMLDINRHVMHGKVSFTTYPVIKELKYKGVEIEKPRKIASEQDIDESIERMMFRKRRMKPVDREVRMDDQVEVSFTGVEHGTGYPFEYDHADKAVFVIGTNLLFTGLDEKMIGMKAGDDLECTLTMSRRFHREAVAGKTLDLKIHLKQVFGGEIPELTDEFVAKEVHDCKNIAELREKHRDMVQTLYDADSDRAFELNQSDALANQVTCHIPDVMIQTALQRYMGTLGGLSAQQGISVEESLKEANKTEAEFREMCTPLAYRQARVSIALDYIIRHENLEVTEDEFNERVSNVANQRNSSVEDTIIAMGGPEKIIEDLLNDKAMKLYLSYAIQKDTIVDEYPKFW